MKQLVLFLLLFPLVTQSQVGINTTDPKTALDVVGAITNREVSFAVAANAVNINTETSLANITGAATATVAVTSYTPAVNGHRLIISNNTSGGFGATFAGITIPSGQSIEFVYTNSAWKSTLGGTGTGTNLYNADGTLSGTRTVTQNANNLTFTGTGNTIFNTGKVGVGTTNPIGKLNVAGGLVIGSGTNGANTTGIPFTFGNTTNSAIWFGNSNNSASNDYGVIYKEEPTSEVSTLNILSGDNASGSSDDAVFVGNVDWALGAKKGITIKNGFAGIGTTSPTAQLHTTGSVLFAGAGTPALNRVLVSDATGLATWQKQTATNTDSNAITASTTTVAVPSTNVQGAISDLATAIKSTSVNAWNLDGNSNGAIKKFGTIDGFDIPFITSNTERMRIKSTGEVGIGLNNPNGKLHLFETTGTNLTGTTGSFILEHGDVGGQSSILFKSTVNAGSDYGYIKYSDDGSGTGSSTENSLLEIGIQNDVPGNIFEDDIAIMSSGNVGVGTRTPLANFHTVGSVMFSGAGTPALNRVLVSDATGLATWQKQTATNTDSNAIIASGTSIAVPSTNVQGAIGDLATAIKSASSNAWNLDGNTNGAIKKLGTIDGFDVPFITSNVERMRILSTGNIGIGTTTAPQKLTISGNLPLGFDNASLLQAKNATGTYESFLWPRWSDDVMYLNYGNNGFNIRNNASVSTMFMTNAGNVGIGTTTPNASLQFANTIANRRIVLWESANNDHQFYGFGINNSTLRYQVNAATDSHIFYAGSSATTSNELMRIQGNGRVGVGTNAPQGKFNVSGGVVVGSGTFGGNTAGIPFGYGDTTNSALWFGNYDNTASTDYGVIYFQQNTANVSTLNILSGDDSNGGTIDDAVFIGNVDTSSARRGITVKSGHVGIGTTTPLAKLDLIGAKTTGAGTGTGAANDGPSQGIIPAGFNGTSRFNDWPSGWGGGISTYDIVGSSSFMSGYITRSDFRLKNDIKSIDNSIVSNFMKIRPVTYFLKEQTKETEGLQYGFIAQEIRDLFPSMVTQSTDPNGIIGMNYQALISPTIYVVQQQQAKIEELQKQVDSQNDKLSKMEAELQQIKALLRK